MIEKSESLVHSEKVLKLVRSLAKGLDLSLGVWSNGREQGFFLAKMEGSPDVWAALVFAQYRSSDSMMVVFGPYQKFDTTTHTPAEELWGGESKGHMKFFPPDKDYEAAKFIVDFLAYYPLKDFEPRPLYVSTSQIT